MAHETDMLEDDAEALRVRREDLYAFMQEITAAALMLPQPETYIEAERAVRTIATADRLIHQFDLSKPNDEETAGSPAPWSPASFRKGLRMLADRMMAAAKTIPVPDTALTALRALRYAKACDRMLTQLYTPPKPAEREPATPEPSRPPQPETALPTPSRATLAIWEEFRARYGPKPAARRVDEEPTAQSEAEAPEPTNPDIEKPEPPTAETVLNPHPGTSEEQDENPSGQMPDQHDPP